MHKTLTSRIVLLALLSMPAWAAQVYTKEEAVKIAADFTVLAIENTVKAPAHWYGVKFETAIPELIRMLTVSE